MKTDRVISKIMVGFARDGSTNFITAYGLRFIDIESSDGYMFLQKYREDDINKDCESKIINRVGDEYGK